LDSIISKQHRKFQSRIATSQSRGSAQVVGKEGSRHRIFINLDSSTEDNGSSASESSSQRRIIPPPPKNVRTDNGKFIADVRTNRIVGRGRA
jgi:hypothetical protein